MWFVQACRGCLDTEGKLERVNNITWRMFEALTGLQFSDTDGYPNMLCTECRWILKKSITYRRKCRRGFMVLKQIMSEKNSVLDDDIKKVNRLKNNLESSVGLLRLDRTATYNALNCIDTEVTNVDEADNVTTLTRYQPKIDKATVHIVDIPPFVDEIIFDNDTMAPQNDFEMKNEEKLEDYEIKQSDNLNSAIPENIDMDDVFADLQEETLHEEETLHGEETEEQNTDHNEIINTTKIDKIKRPPKKLKENRFYNTKTVNIMKLAMALGQCNIRLLSTEEQLDIVNARLEEPKFVNDPFKCLICVTVFESIEDLEEHVILHNKVKGNFNCAVCKYKFSFSVEPDLLYHNSTHHLYEYMCNHCSAKMYSTNDLVAHITKEHGLQNDNFYKNMICLPKTPKEMYQADIIITKKLSYMKCSICQFYVNKRDFMNHLIKHEKPKSGTYVKCDICSIWIKKLSMTRHMRTHKYKYKCKLCDEMFMVKKMAILHNNKHQEIMKCDLCKRQFKKYGNLWNHKVFVHKSIGEFHCCICGFTFDNKHLFYEHQLIKHGYFLLSESAVGNSQFCCTACDIQFINEEAHKSHSFFMHAKLVEETNVCKTCNKIFFNSLEFLKHQEECIIGKCPYCSLELKNGLYTHIETKHPGLPYAYKVPTVICEICGKEVPSKNISNHQKQHKEPEEKNILNQCPYCDQMNVWKGPTFMILHIARRHISSPWQCKVCLKKYNDKQVCKEHIMTKHGGYKISKFMCELCHRTIGREANLHRHYQTVHSIKSKNPREKMSQVNTKKPKTVYVYPHMQLDLTEVCEITPIPTSAFGHLKVEVWDYFNNVIGHAPNNFDFIKISKPDHIDEDEMKRRKKLKINIYDTSLNCSAIMKDEQIEQKSNDMNDQGEIEEPEQTIVPTSSHSDSKATDPSSGLQESNSCDALEIDDSRILLGDGGEQYIMINDVFYKIEDQNMCNKE